MCGCLLGKFSKRVRWIDSFEDADLKVILKVVLVRVGADIELIGDALAVDCVEQRVKFIRSCQYLICNQAKPDGPDLNTRNGTAMAAVLQRQSGVRTLYAHPRTLAD